MKPLSKDLTYFLSGSVFLGFSSAYSLLVPVIIVPYIIQTVGLSNYGLSVIAFSATFFLSLIIDYGYNITGVNSLAKSTSVREKGDIIIRIIYTKAILCLLLFILFAVSLIIIPYLKEYWILFSLSMLIPISSIFSFNWAIQGLEMIRSLSGISIINKTIYLLGIFLFVQDKDDYIFINFIFGLGSIISGIYALFLIKRKVPVSIIRFTFSDFLIEIKNSVHYFISNISIYISTSLYPVILGTFVSTEIVGVFAVVEKIYNVIRAPFSIYINLMLPRISSIVEESYYKAIKTIKKTYVFVIAFIIISLVVTYVFEKEIINYFIQDYYDLSTQLLHIGYIGIIIVLFNCPVYLILLALNMKRAIMKTFIFVPIIGIIMCFLLSKFYGATGAFLTIVLVEFCYVLSLLYLYKRRAR